MHNPGYMHATHHRDVTVDGHRLFYRKAGPADAPALGDPATICATGPLI